MMSLTGAVRARALTLSGSLHLNQQEFHAMVDFVNPNILSSLLKFRNVFERPILESREMDADAETRATGLSRARQLSELVQPFILRRTSQTNMQYLPAKSEHTIFIRLSDVQVLIYEILCAEWGPAARKASTGKKARSFELITALKKLCNGPDLLRAMQGKDIHALPDGVQKALTTCAAGDTSSSGKFYFLDGLLQGIAQKREKIVIVSNFTETLFMISEMCKRSSYGYFQLDGSTPVKRRQVASRVQCSRDLRFFIFLMALLRSPTVF
jgi:SNF2 family DNA or RNA helicase